MTNVTFNVGEELGNGFRIIGTNGLSNFVAKSENITIGFTSDAGEGINYSKVLYFTNEITGKTYRAGRYLYKYVALVQGFSNTLYMKYKNANTKNIIQ